MKKVNELITLLNEYNSTDAIPYSMYKEIMAIARELQVNANI